MSEIRPALTAEEWKRGPSVADLHPFEEEHAIAAVALHGQPFGFTWDDVDAIREVASEARAAASETLNDFAIADFGHLVARVEEVADRIAALLPPREP